ncbi:MAG: 50S ribosomal protein L20 [Deltaproteobacteria bacterium]|nr:MAG: 50S ribosomal protein L20 [Deltaproteobacteria bacterium]
MPRAKKGFKARRRRNRVLKAIKGYRGKRGTCYAIGSEALHHAWQHMYRGRKQRKRDFRALWIARINAAVRPLDLSYSRFMGGLKANGVGLNRKMLAEIAISDPAAFKAIAETAARA